MAVFNNALAGAAGSGGAAAYEIKRSLRFNSDDSAYLRRDQNTEPDQGHWTYSFWVKRHKLGTEQTLLRVNNGGTDTNNMATIDFRTDDKLQYYVVNGGTLKVNKITNKVFKDVSAWYHIIISLDLPTLRIWVNGVQIPDSELGTNSPNDSSYTSWIGRAEPKLIGRNTTNGSIYGDFSLAEVHFLEGTAVTNPNDFGEFDADTGVWNPKEYTGSHGTNGFHLDFSDNSSNAALGYDAAGSNDFNVYNLESGVGGNVDISGYTVTSGPGTGPNDPKRTFNGDTSDGNYAHGYGTHYVHITTTSSPIAVSSSDNLTIWWKTSVTNPRDAILELVINGTARVYSTFTNTGQGSVQSNTVTVGYTGNVQAIKLNEASSSSPGELHIQAIQLNGTYLVSNEETDSFLDSPTNYEADTGNNGGNYATWDRYATHPNTTVSNGNLDVTSSAVYTTASTLGFPSSGKFYGEFTVSATSSGYPFVGIGAYNDAGISGNYNPDTGAFYAQGGYITGGVSVSSLTSLSAGDIVGVAYDAATREVWFRINGNSWVNSGDPAAGTNPTCTLPQNSSGYGWAVSTYQNKVSLNAGQRPFNTTPPTGFVSLCTQNLPDTVVGKTVFDAVIYDGNGGTNVISDYKFSPDLAWFKRRDATGYHVLSDTLRTRVKGFYISTGANQAGGAEFTSDANKDVASFDSNGFTLGPNNQTGVNENNAQLVAWAWDAGDAANATSVSVGSLNSSSYSYGTYSSKWNDTSSPSSTGTVNSGANAFNGDLGNYASLNQSNTFSKWKPTSPIQINSSLRVLASGISSGNNQVAVNGTYFYVTNKPVWYTISASYLTEIRLQDVGSTHGRLWAVEVDGKLLIDNSITPPNVPSIATSYRANDEAGFSIISYQGNGNTASVASGLSGDPGMIFIKDRDATTDWPVYHAGFDDVQNNVNILNNNSTVQSLSGYWTGTRSNVIGLVSGSYAHNTTGRNYIAYCWAQRDGFSKFNEYRGDGQPDGPFIYTGFRPRWILIKHTGGQDWVLFDTTRDHDNDNDIEKITTNEPNGEVTHSNWIDILSNGFKLRTNAVALNENGTKYIYSAFADHPLKLARAR